MGANAADYPSWLADFVEPKDSRYAMQPIIHDWPQDIDGMVEALKAYGCRGAVLNCPFANEAGPFRRTRPCGRRLPA